MPDVHQQTPSILNLAELSAPVFSIQDPVERKQVEPDTSAAAAHVLVPVSSLSRTNGNLLGRILHENLPEAVEPSEDDFLIGPGRASALSQSYNLSDLKRLGFQFGEEHLSLLDEHIERVRPDRVRAEELLLYWKQATDFLDQEAASQLQAERLESHAIDYPPSALSGQRVKVDRVREMYRSNTKRMLNLIEGSQLETVASSSSESLTSTRAELAEAGVTLSPQFGLLFPVWAKRQPGGAASILTREEEALDLNELAAYFSYCRTYAHQQLDAGKKRIGWKELFQGKIHFSEYSGHQGKKGFSLQQVLTEAESNLSAINKLLSREVKTSTPETTPLAHEIEPDQQLLRLLCSEESPYLSETALSATGLPYADKARDHYHRWLTRKGIPTPIRSGEGAEVYHLEALQQMYSEGEQFLSSWEAQGKKTIGSQRLRAACVPFGDGDDPFSRVGTRAVGESIALSRAVLSSAVSTHKGIVSLKDPSELSADMTELSEARWKLPESFPQRFSRWLASLPGSEKQLHVNEKTRIPIVLIEAYLKRCRALCNSQELEGRSFLGAEELDSLLLFSRKEERGQLRFQRSPLISEYEQLLGKTAAALERNQIVKPRATALSPRKRRAAQKRAKAVENELEAPESIVIKDRPIKEAWADFHQNRDPVLRHKIVLHYLNLVKAQVKRIARKLPSHVDPNELWSDGYSGLEDAVDSFDPTRGKDFRQWSGARIAGAIQDGLRIRNWTPRIAQHREKLVDQARHSYYTRHGDFPDRDELKEELNRIRPEDKKFSERQLNLIVGEVRPPRLGSLNRSLNGNGRHGDEEDSLSGIDVIRDPLAEDPSDLAEPFTGELMLKILQSRRPVQPPEIAFFQRYIDRDEGLRRAGESADVSESRMSQIKKQLASEMKAIVGEMKD